MHYIPIALPFLIFFAFLFAILIILIEIDILRYAYDRMGVGRRHMFALLFFSFVGSYVNIPIYDLAGTVIAVNLGGAVIPFLLSIYLWLRNRLYVRGLIGVAIVTFCVHMIAYPVRGMGIAVPTLIPSLIAAPVAFILSRRYAPPLAYISGSLGTLIGADLLNIGQIQALGAPIASIGGAGKFDGIFLTGILSVFLASLLTRRKGASQ
ncbi:MAG TPA: DUF1614 domain-containing protein [Syntrophales bacterium]|nr:DUF1614 domain-containing protein [Syntrophales bacterium]